MKTAARAAARPSTRYQSWTSSRSSAAESGRTTSRADESDRDHGDAEDDAHGADKDRASAACLGLGVGRLGGVVGWIGHHEECTGGRVGRMLSRPPRGRRPGPVHGWPVNLVRA
jgi:hypothetical protein